LINNQHHRSFNNDSQVHDTVRATVVLPGGVHSLPSKGGPSSLLERWKSGGSCDCGGWDLACKLKILAGENQASKKSWSSKAYFADYQFDLFVQVLFVLETYFVRNKLYRLLRLVINYYVSLFVITTGERTRSATSIQLNAL
jgi:hypothetical protein